MVCCLDVRVSKWVVGFFLIEGGWGGVGGGVGGWAAGFMLQLG